MNYFILAKKNIFLLYTNTMRIEHLTAKLNFNSSPHIKSARGKMKQNADYYDSHTTVNKTSVENNNRPAKSINFSGSVSFGNIDTSAIVEKSLNKLINEGVREYKSIKAPGRFAHKIIDSDFFNNALKLVKENEAKFENIITIFLAGLLKPICVLAMPGAEEEDKQMAATKNFVAAVTGFALSMVILTPVSKAVKEVTGNLPKYIKDPKYRKLIDPKEFGDSLVATMKDGKKLMAGDLADSYSTFYKKVADLAITPTKAAITIAFMPHLLNLLFGKRKAEKAAAKKAQMQIKAQEITLNQNEQIYKQFSGGMIK